MFTITAMGRCVLYILILRQGLLLIAMATGVFSYLTHHSINSQKLLHLLFNLNSEVWFGL